MLQIEIDSGSGFCFGVTTAIRKAEEELAKGGTLYCLGDIVHNSMECERLRRMGLVTITHEEMASLKGVKVLLRAHGEPPETYELARRNEIEIIDATCPVVLKLQTRIKQQYQANREEPCETEAKEETTDYADYTDDNREEPCETEAKEETTDYADYTDDNRVEPCETEAQIVIFGKKGHAEVLGLEGQTQGSAIVIESFDEATHLDFTRDIYLYSQTTKSLDEFHRITEYIQQHMEKGATFRSFDTICRSVANRMPSISQFASRHDLILFVCGRKSSNGRVLYEECRRVNANSHLIEGPEEIDPAWLNGIATVGICGATSTPKWLMEQCRDILNE